MPTSESPAGLLTSCKVEEKVNEIIRNSKRRTLPWRELKILFSYVAAHLFLNAQRPASIQSMTVQEFKYHVKTSDGQYCIKVAKHKSAGTHGPSEACTLQKDLMEFYLQHIRKMIPLNEFKSQFFLTDSGNEFKSISATVKCVGTVGTIKMFTFCLVKTIVV